jgi:hypothetical protein
MARWPPAILSATSSDDGGVEVKWGVDSFFADAEAPEKVLVDLNGIRISELDEDEDSVEISKEKLAALASQGATAAAISISFWWSGSPAAQELQSTITVPLQTGAVGGGSGVLPAAKPIVTVVKVQARTRQAPNSITIAWKSNNYNDGKIIWGPANHADAFRHNIRPHGEVYHGTFQTDQPLSSATNYVFKVEVRNTLHSPGWISTAAVVRSALDTVSLRQFLQGSGLPIVSSIRGVAGADRSLRHLILG